MRIIVPMLLCCTALNAHGRLQAGLSPQPRIKAYYTRLPFDDAGFTGKYADIVVDLPQRGQFVFCREFGYQPYWLPVGGRRHSVARLIPRRGDGPDQRPDNHNICCNVSIVEQTDSTVTIHWRYAPDLTKPSFVDYLAAYNQAGNPSSFFGEYAGEYFTIDDRGNVARTVKNGCYSLDAWRDPRNQIEQTLQLTPDGIQQTAFRPATISARQERPVAGETVKSGRTANLVRHWKFDEANGSATKEQQTGTACNIRGVAAYWRKGVSGTCLSFDSYSSAVVLPAKQCPNIQGEITISVWIAVQEYPFNLAALLEHLDGNNGYFLGVNGKGQIEFKIGDGDAVHSVTTAPVPLYEWTHVTAVAKGGAEMVVYLNGEPATAAKPLSGRIMDAPDADLSIGMTCSVRQFPLLAERASTKKFRTSMVFSGLIDEVKLFDKALIAPEVKAEYDALKPVVERPLQPWVLPAGPEVSPGFRAEYMTLNYSPEWDGLWRVGDHADIVVTFADKPWRYVFWRGTRYLPSLVTDYGPRAVWSNDQGPERYDVQCYEHMSDILCRFSYARIIHRSDARAVVHWRNASVSIDYRWPKKDGNGWGIWTDEYWTVYPDGVSIRHQQVHNNTDKPTNAELNQNEVLHQPGQTTEDVLHDAAVIITNTDGETQARHRSAPQPKKLAANWNLQYLNLKSETRQFEIGEVGAWSQTFLHSDVYWRGWNHYPVQLIPSDGTRVDRYDRPASSCPATMHELRHEDGNNIEAMVMYGLTDKQPAALTRLNRSWNFAPAVVDCQGCQYHGYEKRERAFKFSRSNDVVAFTIRATPNRPLENPAFVVANWGGNNSSVSLKIGGQTKVRGADYKTGIELDTDGGYTMVIWMPWSSTETVSFEVAEISRSWLHEFSPRISTGIKCSAKVTPVPR